MSPIAYAENLSVYFIEHAIDDFIYFRFCNGKLKRAKIKFDFKGDAYFLVEKILTYYLNEIIKT